MCTVAVAGSSDTGRPPIEMLPDRLGATAGSEIRLSRHRPPARIMLWADLCHPIRRGWRLTNTVHLDASPALSATRHSYKCTGIQSSIGLQELQLRNSSGRACESHSWHIWPLIVISPLTA